ncbi:hypothetical protein OQJ02_05055 [Legionella sp. PATHC032]|uniref:hypothetical protein n=1 Tax=Legionella sp. PATHC032 TaxID=2992039 RepID=UPI001B06FF84|nr:hypothetical protein [Legionella sp. PATHC032]MCW8420998.1 hypothetical protein [Legionella sp. PATHC032]HAZ7573793.1 hypothetical protein [Legionella pneumophila]HBA1634299.1 hypothetical protein [Legionella pneumophila]
MRNITPEDLKTFEKYRSIEDAWRAARDLWLDQVKRVHSGEIDYQDTRPMYDEYMRLCKEWEEFRHKHADILLVKVL